MNQTQIRYLLAAGWGIYAGAVAGYLFSKKKHEEIANQEIESVKASYERRKEVVFNNFSGGKDTVEIDAEVVKERLDEILTGYDNLADRYEDLPRKAVDPRISPDDLLARESMDDEIVTDPNAVSDVDPEDLESIEFEPSEVGDDEVRRRFDDIVPDNPDQPYVITVDQFLDDNPAHSKVTLNYYEGDDVLADESDRVVRSLNAVIGDEAVTKFGKFSNDPDVVYVRNEKMETDYEVTLEKRSFQEVVLNIRVDKPRVRKMREDD